MRASIVGCVFGFCGLLLVSGCDRIAFGYSDPVRHNAKLIGKELVSTHTLPTQEILEIFAVEAGGVPLQLKLGAGLSGHSGGNEWNWGAWDSNGNLITFQHKPENVGLNIVCRLTTVDGCLLFQISHQKSGHRIEKRFRESREIKTAISPEMLRIQNRRNPYAMVTGLKLIMTTVSGCR